MDQNRDKLYNNLIGSGKFTEQQIGSKDEFIGALSNPESVSAFYDRISGMLPESAIGTKEQFTSLIGADFVQPQRVATHEPRIGPSQGIAQDIPQQPIVESSPLWEEGVSLNISPSLMRKEDEPALPFSRMEIKSPLEPQANYQPRSREEIESEMKRIDNDPRFARYVQLRNKASGGRFGEGAIISKEDRQFYQDNKEWGALIQNNLNALSVEKDALILAENLAKAGGSKTAVGRFWDGLVKTGRFSDFVSLGLTRMSRDVGMIEVLKKASEVDFDDLTSQEQQAVQAWSFLKEVEGANDSFALKAGRTFQDMIPFVVNMIATGGAMSGLRTGIQAGLRTGTKEAAKQMGLRGMAKYRGKQLAEVAIFNALRAPLTTTHGTAQTRQRLSNFSVQDGRVVRDPNASALSDTYKGFMDNYLEYFSESLGGMFTGGKMQKLLGGRLGNMVGLNAERLAKLTNNPIFRQSKNILDKAQVQGIITENFEEVANAALNTLLTGSDDIKQLADPEFYALTTINTLLLGGAITGANYTAGAVGSRIEKGQINTRAREGLNALEGIIPTITDEELARQIQALSEDITEGRFMDENGDITKGAVLQQLNSISERVEELGLSNEESDSILLAASQAVSSGATREGMYEGIEAMAKEEMGGEFTHKRNPNAVIIAADINGEQYYMLDHHIGMEGKSMEVVRPITGGETQMRPSLDFNDIQSINKKDFIDSYLAARDQLSSAQEQVSVEEELLAQAEAAAPPTTTIEDIAPGREFVLEGENVRVIDISEDGIIVEDVDGAQHIVSNITDLQSVPPPVDQPALSGDAISSIDNIDAIPENPMQPYAGSVDTRSYDELPPAELLQRLSSEGYTTEEINDLVGEVIKAHQKARGGINRRSVKTIAESVEKKRQLREIDEQISSLESIVQAQEENTEQARIQAARDNYVENFNRLLSLVKTHNQQTPAKRRNANVTPLLRRANDIGLTLHPNIDGTYAIMNEQGERLRRPIVPTAEREAIQSHRALSDYPVEFQSFVERIFAYPEDLRFMMDMARNDIAQGVNNILEGTRTVAANELLDNLESIFNSGVIELDFEGRFTTLSIEEYFTAAEESNDITEEDMPDEAFIGLIDESQNITDNEQETDSEGIIPNNETIEQETREAEQEGDAIIPTESEGVLAQKEAGNFEDDTFRYPTQEETPVINERFDQFFDTIQEKVDEETGDTLLYRSVENSQEIEINQIKRRSIENGTFMLAPNGQPTNLNERQWLQVRTEAFRNWFGDWELAGKLSLIEGQKPIEIKNYDVSIEEAKVAYKQLNESKNKIDGRNVRFVNSAFGKIIHHRGFDTRRIVPQLVLIFENSIPIYSEAEIARDGHKKHTNFKGYHNYLGRVAFDNKEYYVRITLQELNAKDRTLRNGFNPNELHSTFISDIELYEIENPTNTSVLSQIINRATTKPISRISDTKLQQFFEEARIAYQNSSKIVDENGEPMVVYHGTNEHFSVFTESKSKGTHGEQDQLEGVYFTDRRDVAEWYSDFSTPEYVKNVFLNLKKPYQSNNIIELKEGFGSDVLKGISKKVQEGGFDGILIDKGFFTLGEQRLYLAFEPNQIKSATDNTGEFSAENNDIRYRFIGEQGATNLDKAEEATMRLDNLAVAREMEAENKDPRVIKLATGWERGADGKWRYEVEDVKSINKEVFNSLYGGETYNTVKLPQLIGEDNDLFTSYPQLKEVDVARNSINSLGVFSRGGNGQITINEKLTSLAALPTLIHEIQHAIQDIEGFARGSNSRMFENASDLSRAYKEFDANIRTLDGDKYENIGKVLKSDRFLGYRNVFSNDVVEGEFLLAGLLRNYEEQSEEVFMENYEDFVKEGNKGNAQQQYHQTSGEVEARNTETRRNMSIEERRKSLAEETEDIARKDQIFIESRLLGVANAERGDRDGNPIGDGSFHVEPDVFEFDQYPQIKSDTSYSDTTESTYITYRNTENGKSIAVRFSNHESNAVRFGDQLNGWIASRDEVLYHLGLKQREFIPETFLLIATRKIAKKQLGDYEEADKSIQEMYALGANADISEYKGKLAKGSNYLILGDKVDEEIRERPNAFGDFVQVGSYVYSDISYRSNERNRAEINEWFNEQLQQQIDGTLPKGHIYELGNPSDILLSAGIPDLPIELSAERLLRKSEQEGHLFDLSEIKNLPDAIQNPLAIFDSTKLDGSKVILTELQHKGSNYVVVMRVQFKGRGRHNIQINDIKSIYPKDHVTGVLDWITSQDNLLRYVDKEKTSNYISVQSTNLIGNGNTVRGNGRHSKQRYNSAEVRKLFNRATKIINDFENPTLLEGEKSAEVSSLSESLNVPIKIARDINEIPEDPLKRSAKGWFDPKTGEVVVVLPNNTSTADTQATVLHEVVGHKGLRGLLGDQFAPTMNKVFAALPERVKSDYLAKHSTRVKAAEEYLSEMAEQNISPSTWERIKAILRDVFRSIGINLKITDADMAYMLWRSRNRLQRGSTDIDIITNSAKSRQYRNAINDNVLFREDMRPSTNSIELTDTQKRIERWQNRMISVRTLMNTIRERGGTIGDFSNPYVNETLSTSRAKAELDDFQENYYQSILDDVKSLLSLSRTYEDINLYLIAKHAAERNRVITSREVYEYINLSRISLQDRELLDKHRGILDRMIKNGYSVVFEGGIAEMDLSGLNQVESIVANSIRNSIIKRLNYIKQSENGNTRSGLSNEDAAGIVASFEDGVDQEIIDSLWSNIRRSTEFSLEKSRKYGLISEQSYQDTKGMYEYYVPLRGWEETEDVDYSDVFGSEYMGATVLNPINKQAKGRQSLADDPLGYIASMAESAVISGNKNDIRRNAWRMVVNNRKMENLFVIRDAWEINVSEPGEEPQWVVTYTPPSQAQIDAGAARRARPNNSYHWHKSRTQIEKHQVRVLVDGKEVILEFKGTNGTRVAMAINGANVARADNRLFRSMAGISRFMAAGMTSRNPDFMMTNFFRDALFGSAAYFIRGGNSTKLAANLPTAFKAIHDDFAGRNKDSDIQKIYRDFKMSGGETGYVHMKGVDTFKKEINRMVKDANMSGLSPAMVGRKTVKALTTALDYTALMSENSMRFSTYLTEIQRMTTEAGIGITEATDAMKQKAALAAKELTTNFNRKGRYSGIAGGFYAFFNAAIQGSANVISLAKENPARFTTTVSTMIALQVATSLLSSLISDDDESGENEYDNISEYVRNTNIILPLGGKQFLTIPSPHGFRALMSVGNLTVDYARGKKSWDEAIIELLKNVAGELSPLSLEGIDIRGAHTLEGFGVSVVPTAIKPIVESVANMDFMGNPIYSENYISTQDGRKPKYLNAPKNTNHILVGTAKQINEWAGGSEALSSAIDPETGERTWTGYLFDINPAAVEHVFQGYLGGRLRFWNDSYKTATSLIAGETPEKRNIPVVRRLWVEPFGSSAWRNYYELRDRVEDINAAINASRKIGDWSSYSKVNSLYNHQLMTTYKAYQDMVIKLSNMMKVIPNSDLRYKMLDEKRDNLVVDLHLATKRIDKAQAEMIDKSKNRQ